MKTLTEILPTAEKILKKYDLCDSCLGRLFAKQLHLSSNKILGKKIRHHLKSSPIRCYVCKNLTSHLNSYLKLMSDLSSEYDYSTMVVGVIIKPSIVDRDDFIRSTYKLRGIDSVKTDITKELAKQFTRKTKKIIDYLDPDLTFTINLKDESCSARSKPVFLQGKYVKTKRGFPQKQKSCSNCTGKGCRICNYHGIENFESVEGKISQYLFSKFGGKTAKFTWIGGEDKSSLVLGSGRPFFVKIINPYKRKTRLAKKVKLEPIEIFDLRQIQESPKTRPKFYSLIELQINTQDEIDSTILKKLRSLSEKPIVVYEKSGKRSEKIISDLKYKRTSKNSFSLKIWAEGGLPVKRFVISDDVNPGISKILGMSCTCLQFDFHDVKLK